MRLIERDRNTKDLDLGIIFGSIALLALAAARIFPIADLLPSCRFRAFTGLACPTCGTTRSLMHLAGGEPLLALAMNPAFFLLMASALAFMVYECVMLFRGRRHGLIVTPRESSLARRAAVSLFLANWLYLIVSL